MPRRPLKASRKLTCALTVTVAAVASTAAHAQLGDTAAGRAKAKNCVVCHGPSGISQMPNVPHLAGQPEFYTAAQLKAYRSGKRLHEVMNVVAKPLADADINDLAAWYASIEVSAKPPGGKD